MQNTQQNNSIVKEKYINNYGKRELAYRTVTTAELTTTFGDGSVYTCPMKDGKQNGTGTMTCPDGTQYKSTVKDGKIVRDGDNPPFRVYTTASTQTGTQTDNQSVSQLSQPPFQGNVSKDGSSVVGYVDTELCCKSYSPQK